MKKDILINVLLIAALLLIKLFMLPWLFTDQNVIAWFKVIASYLYAVVILLQITIKKPMTDFMFDLLFFSVTLISAFAMMIWKNFNQSDEIIFAQSIISNALIIGALLTSIVSFVLKEQSLKNTN